MLKNKSNIFEVRLIPLDTVWTQIPTYLQFWPIIVRSAMHKFMELRLLPKLWEYMINDLSNRLRGYVSNEWEL
jgi:hypothetical protein